MKTYIPKKEEIAKKWYLVDAKGKILGRLATRIARILSGKDKPIYTPHLDTGDFVVVINAREIKVTGKKEEEKIYYRHSGYPGGLKKETLRRLRERKPEEIIRRAVKGMLPKNKLGRKMLKKLKIYPDANHPHQAQNPEPINL
ncbi:50S ribosomal protein L13 [Candidatus Aerophobetes bacterium]|uniref:Large ribosomal subunit protein uL13 n=1 Tax=Aerophobetes bacterium TaxID=2030807 RepID=A0A662DMZ1_UNCAE|nr:MAG: 50S ribosomal protein L13 [Candidatus Aerophobetes bacterium]